MVFHTIHEEQINNNNQYIKQSLILKDNYVNKVI